MMRANHLDEEEAETSPMIISIFLDDDETEQESLWIESATDSGNHTAAAGKEIALASAQVSASESNSNPASLNKFKVYLLAICMALYALVMLLSMHLFADQSKAITYEQRHVRFLIDLLKILAALCLEYYFTQGHLVASFRIHVQERPLDALRMLIPALLFETHDWLARISLVHLQPMPFRFIKQTQILVIALVSMKILKSSYSRKQWLCLVVVWMGMFCLTIDHPLSKSFWNHENSNSFLGIETVSLAVILF